MSLQFKLLPSVITLNSRPPSSNEGFQSVDLSSSEEAKKKAISSNEIITMTVGELFSKKTEDMNLEWRIVNFFSLPDEENTCFFSPSFDFMGEPWFFMVYPNGERKYGTKGWISAYLQRDRGSSPITVTCSIGIKTVDGKKYADKRFTYDIKAGEGYGFASIVERSELIEKKTTLVPFDALTIICSLKGPVPLGCISRTEELSRDLSSLSRDETDYDVVMQVEAEEFRVHRSVLGARSPVLAAMFRHEMAEKMSGVVSVGDCRADVFRIFAHYLYTGKVEDLSASNVFDLFKLADRNQVTELADECLDYMQNTLTVDTFYDALEVALNYKKEELMLEALDFLRDRMGEIFKTEQWRKFLLKDPLRANELLEKACDKVKNVGMLFHFKHSVHTV